MKRLLLLTFILTAAFAGAKAQDKSDHIQIATGLLYEKGWDATLSYEHETKYHNAWEYFANVYLKWDDCPSCGHICPETFWRNYNTWCVGAAYKPCVKRGSNHHGNFRFGGSLGSDRHKVIGGIHAGYEHSFSLRRGWQLGFQVKADAIINGRDLFRTGATIFVKIPTSR